MSEWVCVCVSVCVYMCARTLSASLINYSSLSTFQIVHSWTVTTVLLMTNVLLYIMCIIQSNHHSLVNNQDESIKKKKKIMLLAACPYSWFEKYKNINTHTYVSKWYIHTLIFHCTLLFITNSIKLLLYAILWYINNLLSES